MSERVSDTQFVGHWFPIWFNNSIIKNVGIITHVRRHESLPNMRADSQGWDCHCPLKEKNCYHIVVRVMKTRSVWVFCVGLLYTAPSFSLLCSFLPTLHVLAYIQSVLYTVPTSSFSRNKDTTEISTKLFIFVLLLFAQLLFPLPIFHAAT